MNEGTLYAEDPLVYMKQHYYCVPALNKKSLKRVLSKETF